VRRAGRGVPAGVLRLGDDPVTARIGGTEWTTSLFPKDGRYIVPVKKWVQRAEGLEVGDAVTVRLAVDV
jgi:hypothetical protein